jgi:hypothetical protein
MTFSRVVLNSIFKPVFLSETILILWLDTFKGIPGGAVLAGGFPKTGFVRRQFFVNDEYHVMW